MLRSRLFQDADIDEKEVTTYLFRRNFATTLYGLGLPLSDIQYYLGHDVEDPDTARNHYTNKDKLLAIKDKLDWHPVYAVLGKETHMDCVSSGNPSRQMKDVPGDAFQITFDQNYTNCFIDVQCAEPDDEISLKMTSEKMSRFSLFLMPKQALTHMGKRLTYACQFGKITRSTKPYKRHLNPSQSR